jgi:starch phosphorylase
MGNTAITEKEVKELINGKLSRYFGVAPSEASKDQIYKAVVMTVRDILLEKRQQFHKKIKAKRAKRVYYLCMEFLLGRSLKNSLYNLSATSAFEKAVSSYGLNLQV